MGTIQDYLNSSVSHATMREKDLIPAFLSVLEDLLSPEEYEEISENWEAMEEEERSFYLNGDLWNKLDSLSPEGFYFGAIEGDGSDYGFWEVETYHDEKVKELREANSGKLPAYAWPGGYPLVYFDKYGMTLCPDCAMRNWYDACSAPIIGYDVHWEGPDFQCDDCGKMIESAYGEPEATQEELNLD